MILNTAADPLYNGFYDASGYEPASKCFWQTGTTYTTANGGVANSRIGYKDYLLEQAWVNAGGGFCSLTVDPKYIS